MAARKKIERPTLDPDIIADEEQLFEAIEKVCTMDRRWQRLRQAVRRRQEDLRRLADNEPWSAYLRLEEAVNARAVREHDLLVRWAFDEGRRFGGGG